MKARRGERVGRFAHYGYSINEAGGLSEDGREKEGILLMLELRRQGRAYAPIAKELEARGFVGRSGQRLSAKVIRDIIRRETA